MHREAPLTITTYSAGQFDDDTQSAKDAAEHGPVFITDQGQPAYVLLTIEEYQRLTGKGMSLREMLADTSEEGDFDFDIPQIRGMGFKPVDFD